MALISQTWTLMKKNFRWLLFRHAVLCIWMAFLLPLFLSAFFAFSRNLFVPPATYGFGEARPVRSLASALDGSSGRNKFILVNNGFSNGDIDRVLDRLETQIEDASADMQVIRVEDEDSIYRECPSSLRGVTTCFCAVVMRSSPDEGNGNIWNYTIRTDAEFASSPLEIEIEDNNNPPQIYMLPVQRAVDGIIASINDTTESNVLDDTRAMPFTDRSQEEREQTIREIFHEAIINFMGVLFLSTVLWITYHMTGFIAAERESGMSQLIDAMMPVRQQWMALAARIISHHFSFVMIYAPAWIIGAIIVRAGVYARTNAGIFIIFTLIGGISMASMSIMYASFFKRAQLSGITAVLATGLLGILAQSLTDPGTGIVAVLSALFAPCAFVFFLCTMSHFEEERQAGNLIENPPNSSWQIPGIVFWVFLIIHIFVYPLIGALIERHFYGTTTKGRQIIANDGQNSMGENAVQLQGFSKTYNPSLLSRLIPFRQKPEPVKAVNGLTLNAGRGQIVALLGANGSGKSTTLDAIAGLNKLTDGAISIDGTGGLGIAPQKNVLWDDLTVEEHLNIFNRLKAPKGQRATRQEITDLIASVDLLHKRKSMAKTLSGGQKRKLQLGMMLTGGSAVCCVDEVSSGLDPLSRRKIWDILLAERGRRTLILTTHFLDEADLLADHIAILSKGTLRAEGSSVELKDRLGGGYRVHVPKHPSLPTQMPQFEGVRKKNSLDLISYIAPSSSLAAQVIKTLEAEGIHDYRFSGPTIEDVFLQLAEEIKDEEAFRGVDRAAQAEKLADDDSMTSPNREGLQLMDGQRVGYVKQAMILFGKRITILKRNWLPYVLAFLLPILAAGLTSLFIKGQNPPGCSPADQASRSDTQDAFTQADEDGDEVVFLAGPRSNFSEEALIRLFQPIFAGGRTLSSGRSNPLQNFELVDSYSEFTDFIEKNRRRVTTGLWLGDDNDPPTFAYVANLFVTSGITAQQFLDVIRTNVSIATTWSPFERPFSPSTGDSLNLIVYMGLALALYPAFFALYPSNERRRFVRGLQYSNGVRPFPLWVSYLLFDFIFVLVSSAVVTAIWAGMSGIWWYIEYVFLIMFLYGLAAILMAYVVSLFTKTQLATYAWAAALQVIGFLAYLIAYMCVNVYVSAADIDDTLLIVHFVISALFPIGSVMRALFLSLNLFSTACDNTELSTDPGGILYYGGPILYLILQTIILFALLLWLDSGSAGSRIRGLFSRNHTPEKTEGSDEEVANELTRVESSGTREDGLKVMHLTKSFGKNTAVDNVTFGVKRGEVFALLGPNGAGKSTTISLIRGDIKPSSNGGDVFIEDASVTTHLTAARRNLGVCPQVDALDTMTVREHLEFYAKVRGIPDVGHNVTAVLQAVGLQSFASRMGHALSGGNKRKLSLGIALMGNPTVVLLDEPSSGLDAAAKRVMWKTLADTVPGRSILLTTHSMEEADALAGRAGIMARRMLALGTPDNLRERFGDALHIHLVSKTAPRTSDAEMEKIVSWVRETFPSADVEENTYHGQMRFSVSAADVMRARKTRPDQITQRGGGGADDAEALSRSAIGNLAVILEENKEMLGVGHYSVSPTTLDQVFLTIVGQHNVKEENSGVDQGYPLWKKLLYLKF